MLIHIFVWLGVFESACVLVRYVYGYAMSLFVPSGVPGVRVRCICYVIDVHDFAVLIVYNHVLDELVC